MHIAWTIYNADAGGAVQNTSWRQIHYLLAAGHTVSLITNSATKPELQHRQLNWITIKALAGPWWPRLDTALNGSTHRLPNGLRKKWDCYRLLPQLRLPWEAAAALTQLQRQHPIHICVCNQPIFSPALQWAKEQLGIPYVCNLHGDIFSHPKDAFSWPITQLYRHATRHACSHADAVTSVGQALVQRATSLGAHSVHYLPNGISTEEIGLSQDRSPTPTSNSAQLLFIGRLSAEKGADLAVAALALLDAPSAPHLTLLGAGPEQPRLLQQIQTLGLQNQISLQAPVPRTQLGRWYQSSTVVIVPSRAEAQGLVVLEAMLAGCAIIATDTGGIKDMIQHQHNGILVPADNSQALADAIQALLNDTELRLRLGQRAAQDAKRYSWPALLQQFDRLLATIATPS